MRSVYIILSAVLVMSLAAWAYRENYATQEVLRSISQMQRGIGHQREEQAVLRAEWAYLNRPERLRDLADLNFDRLGLLPLLPEQFGHVEYVAYPQPVGILSEIEAAVQVVGALEGVDP